MEQLTDDLALRLWEIGTTRHALDRGLVLLDGLRPDVTLDSPASVDVQSRDRALLEVWSHLVGDALELHGPCCSCDELLEFTASVEEICLLLPDPSRRVDQDGWVVTFRLPDSRDLATAMDGETEDVLASCLVQVRAPDDLGSIAHAEARLPDPVRSAVESAMAAAAPQADLSFRATCGECGGSSVFAFDPAVALWEVVAARGRRVHHDILTLASAFGWTEPEILALPTARRRTYVAAVG